MGIGKHFESSSGKANKPKKEQNFWKTLWHQCQYSGSSQIPSQDDFNYHQFLSLYRIRRKHGRNKLIIYDTENKIQEVKILSPEILLDDVTSITQLPNGELFCYGNNDSGITLIIDRSYGVRMLPSGTSCLNSSALYFDNNIYCFGAINKGLPLAICTKFDLKNNRWINLTSLPETDCYIHSVIFNRNILVSGYFSKKLWLYSIEIDSFSIIPYEFGLDKRKVLINAERLYLIEWDKDGLIYESEDEYHWKPILIKNEIYSGGYQIYCLNNKEKIYISIGIYYYQFDLKKSVISEINKS